MKLIFATNNRNKLQEVRDILGPSYEISTPADMGIYEDIPETGTTLEANALQKARYVYDRTNISCFADDTGLEVRALDGMPGVYSARYAGEQKDPNANMQLLLSNLQGQDNRGARFRAVIALILEGNEYLFEGEVAGKIIEEPHGIRGFGYDPIFMPRGYDVTFAQMDSKEKNRISHRGYAVARLAEFLKQLNVKKIL